MKCCPTCQRPFPPDFDPGGPVSTAIYNYLARHPEGATRKQVMASVYASDPNGGPTCDNTVSILVNRLNKKLAGHQWKIHSRGGPGSKYVLKQIGA